MLNRVFFLIFASFFVSAQTLFDSNEIVFESADVVAINSLENFFELKNETLINGSFRYYNVLLGAISQVDVSNPIKIWVFYKDFQTAIQLDNTLNPIQKVVFFDAFISHIGDASADRLWRINSDSNQLELYTVRTQKSIPLYAPFAEPIIGFASSQEFCWVQTSSALFLFNTYGSLLQKISFEGKETLAFDGKVLLVENDLGWYSFTYNKDSSLQFLGLKNYLPQRLFPSGNYFYIYKGNQVTKTKLPN